MIVALLESFSAAFAVPSLLSFGAAIAWGLLSVFLSPCHLGAIPLIVGYVNNSRRPERKRAFFLSFIFALGLLIMLSAVGLITSLAGRLIGNVGNTVEIITWLLILACGFWLMDIPPFSRISFAFNVKSKKRGAAGALLLGLVYGVVLGPCAFAFLAPMLLVSLSADIRLAGFGAALMLFYALGHTAAIVLAGTFGDHVNTVLRQKMSAEASLWFKRILGAVVAFVALFQILF